MEGYDGGFGIPQDPYDPIYRKIPTAEEERESEQQKIRAAAFMEKYWKEQARAANAYAARKVAANKDKAYQASGNAALAATYGNPKNLQGQKGGRKTRKSSKRRSRRKSRNTRL